MPRAVPPEAGAGRGSTILRDVSLRIEQDQVGSFVYQFEGSAKGDILDRLQLERDGRPGHRAGWRSRAS